MTNLHTVWLVDEGHAGHRVQSEGVVMALERAGLSLAVERIECRPKLRGIFRPVARAALSRLDGPRAMRFARHVAQFTRPNGPPPSLIISSGGRTAFASRALALETGAPNVFVGNPKPFPGDWFSAVLSPVPLPQCEAIPTGIVPNIVTPGDCAAKAREYWHGPPPPGLWTLLIGGPSRNHLYGEQDWRDIAAGVNGLAERFGIRWLISTSRRTGAEAEAILAGDLAPEAVEELVLYGREPKRVVLPFLGAGERVFVTRDSLTMVSEAVMSGRPVAALLPRRVELADDNFMAVVLRKYASWHQYCEISSTKLSHFVPDNRQPSAGRHEAAEELDRAAGHLVRRLFLAHHETA
ncbi:MAG: ELM1/GtrOC1 family putative glycosyltransferase [Dichotomicrobium sp.]